MRRRLKLLPALWLLALLLAPVVAWVVGTRQPLLTNEPKKEFPAFNRSSLRDEGTYRRIDEAILDRLPFRKEAINLHASIAIDGFRDSSNPAVGVGSGGWLYFSSELRPCMAPDERAQTEIGLEALEILAGALPAGGYRSTIALPAGKQFVHEQGAHSFDEAQERCMRRLRDTIDAKLAELPGGLPLNPDLRRLEAQGEATFLKTDTHWNWRGREQVARKFLDRIRPGLAEEVGLAVGGWSERSTDMNNMLGRFDALESDRVVGVRGPPRRALRPGSVMTIGDSQLGGLLNGGGDGLLPVSAALPDQELFCQWGLTAPCDAQFARAETVVAEMVLRDFHSLQYNCQPMVAAAGERAQGRPGRYVGADGTEIAGDGTLEFGPRGNASVRVELPGPDRDSVPRLVKLPIERIGDTPEGTPTDVITSPRGAGPCSTVQRNQAGTSLLITLPAGRSLSELHIDLGAPPRTRLGRPQSIRLDGTDRTPARSASARQDR